MLHFSNLICSLFSKCLDPLNYAKFTGSFNILMCILASCWHICGWCQAWLVSVIPHPMCYVPSLSAHAAGVHVADFIHQRNYWLMFKLIASFAAYWYYMNKLWLIVHVLSLFTVEFDAFALCSLKVQSIDNWDGSNDISIDSSFFTVSAQIFFPV